MASSSSSSSSSNSRSITLKLLLLSVAVVSVAVTVKLTVPVMLNGLPVIWSVVKTWLKQPYLFVVINGIIITIAASTRFQQNQLHEDQSQSQSQPQFQSQSQPQQQVNYSVPDAPPSSDLRSELPPVANPASFGVMEIERSVTVEPPVVYESKLSDYDLDLDSDSEEVGGDEDEFVTSDSGASFDQPEKEVRSEFNLPVKEKQLVTSRFARKLAKSGPEGARALRVLKPKKHETLETTWKMITDGRQLPLTRHLRKSDTFYNPHHDSDEPSPAAKTKPVRKSETFKERTTYANQNDYPQPSSTNSTQASGGKLKKDGSLSQDELNRRVEAFIKKFNDDMRLQRQESLKQYMEMVNSGAR